MPPVTAPPGGNPWQNLQATAGNATLGIARLGQSADRTAGTLSGVAGDFRRTLGVLNLLQRSLGGGIGAMLRQRAMTSPALGAGQAGGVAALHQTPPTTQVL